MKVKPKPKGRVKILLVNYAEKTPAGN